ncbi:MAG TPA: hypothetical protein VHF65_10355 [Nitrososphaera sp.]|nr:hypothetical protein [Nitrososphaera sp.]
MMKFDSIMEYQFSLPASTLDFYEYHMYSYDKGSVRKALSSFQQLSLANKKMILGELGYKDSMEPSKKDKYKEMELINAILEYACSFGVSPCLLWDLDFYGPENKEKLILLLKDYRDNNR